MRDWFFTTAPSSTARRFLPAGTTVRVRGEKIAAVGPAGPTLRSTGACQKGRTAGEGDPFLPEQALTLPAVLAAYTSGSARVNGLDGVTGAIREGRDAGFAIVDAELARIPAGEIGQASVTQTWIRGQLVHQQQ